jgi:hypothetical protein
VLGNPTTGRQTGSTSPFEFPIRRHTFQNTTVYLNIRKEIWRLCRHPPCSACPKSPKTFIFHVDCYWLAKRNLPTLTLSYIWLVGLWSCPGTGLSYPPRAPWVSPTLAADVFDDETDIIEGLGRLPPELCQMIASYCPESPVWRFSIAVARLPGIFSRLEASKPITLSLSGLPDWTRGTILPSSNRLTMAKRTFVRLSLDGDGIREVEFLSRWPEASSSCSRVQGMWYIMGSFQQLAKLQFQSRVKDMFLDL